MRLFRRLYRTLSSVTKNIKPNWRKANAFSSGALLEPATTFKCEVCSFVRFLKPSNNKCVG